MFKQEFATLEKMHQVLCTALSISSELTEYEDEHVQFYLSRHNWTKEDAQKQVTKCLQDSMGLIAEIMGY